MFNTTKAISCYQDFRAWEDPVYYNKARMRLLGVMLVCAKDSEWTYRSDKELLNSGYLSDCTVVCLDTKWTTHKVILCSRSKWFRAALDGPFQEASTGVVTIEDTEPFAVQAVLDYIYGGGFHRYCQTTSQILEIWKAGDFFGIHDLVVEAQKALDKRLADSSTVLCFNPLPKRKIRKDSHCTESITVKYGRCGHSVREARACPVRNARPQTVFHLREPEYISYREGICDPCCQIRDDSPSEVPIRPTPPADKFCFMIEHEIRALCDALLIAIAGTPQGSHMRERLTNYMCNTRVEGWDGFTLCRFLED